MSAAAARIPSLRNLLCPTIASLATRLPPETRLAALDITSAHISVALSDAPRRLAAPFGILARSQTSSIDARALARAFTQGPPLRVGGLVVSAAPGATAVADIVLEILRHGAGDAEVVPAFPGIEGVLFYCEAEAVRRAIASGEDFRRAAALLPQRLETRKFGRFDEAMHPKMGLREGSAAGGGLAGRARLSASEVLQAVLDDIAREDTVVEG